MAFLHRRRLRHRQNESAGRPSRSSLWVGLLIWCAPYVLLGFLHYGLKRPGLGEPATWISALIGIQLFASIAVVRDVRSGRILACAAMAVYAVYFWGHVPGFAAVGSVLPQLCIVALMAISLWLPFSSGQLSLAQGGFMAVGAYASAWLTMHLQWPFLPALIAGAAGVALFGFIVSYPALRLKGVYLAVATLGLGEVIRIFFVNFEPTGGAFGLAGIPRYTQTWQLVAAVTIICTALYYLMRGRIGRAIWAVRNDEIAAMALGINITHIRIFTFTFGAFIAGLAGGFHAHYIQFVSPEDFGLSALIDWLTIVMLGGFETFFGALAATLVLGTLPELMRFVSEWRLLLNGAILIVFLVLRPGGIVTRELLGWKFSPAKFPAPGKTQEAQIKAVSEPAPLLEVKEVSKQFGGIIALQGVSLVVKRGEIHGLIGPNGAGKTTLFNTIAGFYPVDAGTIQLGGQTISNLPPQQLVTLGIARTFQNIRLFAGLSALENVMLGAYIQRHTVPSPAMSRPGRNNEQTAAQNALALLDMLGLGNHANRPAGALSYGDQRRLEIARALACDPEILLLDEPAAGMNAAEADDLGRLLRRLCLNFGKTILIVEHDMEFVMELCDQITVLNYGKCIASGTPAQVQENPDVVAAYLGSRAQDQQEMSHGHRTAGLAIQQR